MNYPEEHHTRFPVSLVPPRSRPKRPVCQESPGCAESSLFHEEHTEDERAALVCFVSFQILGPLVQRLHRFIDFPLCDEVCGKSTVDCDAAQFLQIGGMVFDLKCAIFAFESTFHSGADRIGMKVCDQQRSSRPEDASPLVQCTAWNGDVS